MLSLHYHELNGKIEEHERNKHLMVDGDMLDKVLDRIKDRKALKKLIILKY